MLINALALALLLAGIVAVMPVTARAANCTVSTRTMAFGNYNPLSGAPRNRATRIITAVCRGNGTLTVALSTGQSNSYTLRYMTSASTSDQLDYNLYIDATRTVVWGDGTGGSQTVSQNFSNSTVRLIAYGQIPAMENIAAGTYTDLITATVTF